MDRPNSVRYYNTTDASPQDMHLSLSLERPQQSLCHGRCLLPHGPLAEPLGLISVSHDSRMGRYSRQHGLVVEPVDPPRALRGAHILAPAVIRVRSDTVYGDDAGLA